MLDIGEIATQVEQELAQGPELRRVIKMGILYGTLRQVVKIYSGMSTPGDILGTTNAVFDALLQRNALDGALYTEESAGEGPQKRTSHRITSSPPSNPDALSEDDILRLARQMNMTEAETQALLQAASLRQAEENPESDPAVVARTDEDLAMEEAARAMAFPDVAGFKEPPASYLEREPEDLKSVTS